MAKAVIQLADLGEDWALFRRPDDEGLTLGVGPFEAVEDPPPNGVAFYVNDFGLTETPPWRVPARVIEDAKLVQSGGLNEPLDWQPPKPEAFADVFTEISQALRDGHLEKSVPVVTERAELTATELNSITEHIVFRAAHFPPPYYSYGWSEGGQGFAGATPELLMAMRKARLQTMALAGTAQLHEKALFAVDDKEIREHEYVAGSLVAKFSDVGMVKRDSRRIMELESLLHFHTPISVELYRNEDPHRLVRLLHPTPALGSLPRSRETMDQLLEWRRRLKCPPYFGAPFGLWNSGYFTCVVAIRGMHWSGSELMLPSGCGVIGESRLLNEWRELALKREAVKRALLL